MKSEGEKSVDESIPINSGERKDNPISREEHEKRLRYFQGGSKEGLRGR
jgi:hypothetical protein